MEQLFDAILEIAGKNPDGFTVDLTTLNKGHKRYFCRLSRNSGQFRWEGLKRVLKHALVHEKKVGGWLNEENGQFYFDSIRIFTNMDEAIRFGRENKQLAIFDLTHLRLVKL